MNKTLIACVLAAMMTTGAVYAQGSLPNKGGNRQGGQAKVTSVRKTEDGQKKNASEKLKALDKNSDGNIARDEASKKLDRRFDKIDTDGNQNLSADELKAVEKSERTK